MLGVAAPARSSPAKWQTSVEVPPMSKPMIRSCPAIWLVRTAPTTPPAGPERIASLPWKLRGPGQPARGLHEHELGRHVALEGRRHPVDVAPEDRREIGVDHRGVAAAHHLHQRAHPVADRDLGEARRLGQRRRPRLVRRVAVAVHEDDGAGGRARRRAPRPAPPRDAPRRAAAPPSRRPAPARAPRSPGNRASPAARCAGRRAAAGSGRRGAAAGRARASSPAPPARPCARGARWWRPWCPS